MKRSGSTTSASFSESRPGIWEARLADGGPLYAETDLTRPIAEPFNALSALVFLAIALMWFWRLRANSHRHPFLVFCVVLLWIGGLGGTLYHGTRASRWFHLMDVVPIAAICISVGAYLWGRLLRRRTWWTPMGILTPMLVPIPWAYWQLPNQIAVSASYLVFAAIVLIPLGLTLKRAHFRHAVWVFAALGLFGIGWAFRVVDSFHFTLHWLPMGSHWLWHLFSAGAVFCLLQYFYEFSRSSARES